MTCKHPGTSAISRWCRFVLTGASPGLARGLPQTKGELIMEIEMEMEKNTVLGQTCSTHFRQVPNGYRGFGC